MVAAAKLRAQEAAESGRPYANRMRRVTANLATKADVNSAPHCWSAMVSRKTHLLVVISADRGLCGVLTDQSPGRHAPRHAASAVKGNSVVDGRSEVAGCASVVSVASNSFTV